MSNRNGFRGEKDGPTPYVHSSPEGFAPSGEAASLGGLVVDDPDFQLWQGDALEMLRGLPSGSVHCALTSPPFYGLRDYGTGSWEGGDEECDHLGDPKRTQAGFNERYFGKEQAEGWQNKQGELRTPFKAECGKCGARRVDNQIGLEATPDEWVARLVEVFREVRRVLRDDGTLWVEIGDSYVSGQGGRQSAVGEMPAAPLALSSESDVGREDVDNGSWRSGATAKMTPARGTTDLKPKDLLGAPWLLAFALRADGWYLRSEIIWDRPNPMPESVTDRPTKSHSTVFLLAKSPRYFFDNDAIREPQQTAAVGMEGRTPPPNAGELRGMTRAGNRTADGWIPNGYNNPAGRNVRSVWRIATQPTPFAHFATWPEKLVERMILAGTSERGCCLECGAPWEREVERGELVGKDRGGNYNGRDLDPGVNKNHGTPGLAYENKTIGWRPTCECFGWLYRWTEAGIANQIPRSVYVWPDRNEAEIVAATTPAVILDPFMGSGTSALVARRLGRRSVGVELSPEYAELCARRLSQQSLFA